MSADGHTIGVAVCACQTRASMTLNDPTCWMLRIPRRGSHLGDFVARGLVSFAWDADVLGDLSAQSDADSFADLQAAGHSKPADVIRDLRIFTERIMRGDVLVIHDHAAADVLFGEVTGDYAYVGDGGVHRQTRPVRWFGRLSTAKVDDVLLVSLTAGRHRIRKLPEQMHWQRLSGEVEDVLGRPATDVRTVARGATTSTGGGRRSRSTPKAPTRTVVPDKLCAACGLLRAPSMFVEDDTYCRDCS